MAGELLMATAADAGATGMPTSCQKCQYQHQNEEGRCRRCGYDVLHPPRLASPQDKHYATDGNPGGRIRHRTPTIERQLTML